LWGLLETIPREIEVATTRNIRDSQINQVRRETRRNSDHTPTPPDRATVRFHRVGRLPADQLGVLEGVPVTSVERTLLDVCGTTLPWVFNEALDRALRRNLTSLERVWDFLESERRSGTAGVQRLRNALILRSEEVGTSRSNLERRFLTLLREAGMPLPELNQEIRGPDGFCAVVDMIYRDSRLVIEIQSYAHHSSLRAFNNDAERLGTLAGLGYRTLEVTADQIHHHAERVIERVSALLEAGDSIPRSNHHTMRG
jgi:hypothetical protein